MTIGNESAVTLADKDETDKLMSILGPEVNNQTNRATIDAAFARHRLAHSQAVGRVPADVVALVVAAREALEEGFAIASSADKLDRAVERFSSRVCYDDDGGSLPEAHAAPCTCGGIATHPAQKAQADG
jgi:hypothetical protein